MISVGNPGPGSYDVSGDFGQDYYQIGKKAPLFTPVSFRLWRGLMEEFEGVIDGV